MDLFIMKFEFLPNELTFECFQYLDTLDLFYSFNELNFSFITTSDSLDRNKLYIWISRGSSSVVKTIESVFLTRSTSLPQISVLSSQRFSKYLRRFLCISSSKIKYSSSTRYRSSVRIQK